MIGLPTLLTHYITYRLVFAKGSYSTVVVNMFSLFFCSALLLLDFLILKTQGKFFFIWGLRILLLCFSARNTQQSQHISADEFILPYDTHFATFENG